MKRLLNIPVFLNMIMLPLSIYVNVKLFEKLINPISSNIQIISVLVTTILSVYFLHPLIKKIYLGDYLKPNKISIVGTGRTANFIGFIAIIFFEYKLYLGLIYEKDWYEYWFGDFLGYNSIEFFICSASLLTIIFLITLFLVRYVLWIIDGFMN